MLRNFQFLVYIEIKIISIPIAFMLQNGLSHSQIQETELGN
jgi:hypothetical protein